MDSIHNKLLLLDFVVEEVNLGILPKGVQPSDDSCVSFQFLNNGPFDIIQNKSGAQKNDIEAMHYGKSCLFALSPSLARSAGSSFDIKIAVFKINAKKLRFCVGITEISLTKMFMDLVKSMICNSETLPRRLAIKNKSTLTSIDGNAAGILRTHISLSCLGKTVVTKIQMVGDQSTVFKGDKNDTMFRCKKKSSEDIRIYEEQPIAKQKNMVEERRRDERTGYQVNPDDHFLEMEECGAKLFSKDNICSNP